MFNWVIDYFKSRTTEKVYRIYAADLCASLANAIQEHEREIALFAVKAIDDAILTGKRRVSVVQAVIGDKIFNVIVNNKEYKESLHTYMNILAKYEEYEACMMAKKNLELLSV